VTTASLTVGEGLRNKPNANNFNVGATPKQPNDGSKAGAA
jgi:hypothetical protein